MAQSTEESSYSFVLRCTKLRQKILIASTKSYIKFDKLLLDKVFCRTLEGGLSRTYVVQENRHLLRAGVSDDELILEKASAAEKERVAVQSKGTLEEQKQERIGQSCLINSNLSQHGREKVVGLVGEKCLVKCIANKNPGVILLDTGTQVSIVSKSYLTKIYPELNVKPLKEILENGDSFRVQWGNSTQIPLLGWTSLNVQVGDETNSATLDVPYLVTSREIEYPIFGFMPSEK